MNFTDYKGTILKSDTVEYGSTASAPTEPEREGYTFDGWSVEFDSITENLTITAQYTINSYIVNFTDYDGTIIKTDTVEYGNTASAPSEPEREEFTFEGWDTEYDSITGDLTIIAKYSAITATEDLITKQLKIYPNPTADFLYIDTNYTGNTLEELDIKIFNNFGQTVYQSSNSMSNLIIDTSDFASGMYFVQINEKTFKIVKN
ncbi:InlB B-repeat-containing protein (plasmid) [Chondrinema litorale]|nr:InlB B-repeat-containing protein [Chondrinema litorale]